MSPELSLVDVACRSPISGPHWLRSTSRQIKKEGLFLPRFSPAIIFSSVIFNIRFRFNVFGALSPTNIYAILCIGVFRASWLPLAAAFVTALPGDNHRYFPFIYSTFFISLNRETITNIFVLDLCIHTYHRLYIIPHPPKR